MKNSETKHHIEIERIILTPDAIDILLLLQEHNNEILDSKISSIKDVICWIVSILDILQPEDVTVAMKQMNILNYLQKDFILPS